MSQSLLSNRRAQGSALIGSERRTPTASFRPASAPLRVSGPSKSRTVSVRAEAAKAPAKSDEAKGVPYGVQPKDRSLGIWPPGSVCGVILGGGESDSRRLFPLTEKRTLPAIPVGGIYRLIDVPLSNLINSGCSKIYVLTQYNSSSLNRYLTRTYNFGSGVQQKDAFVEVVANSQDPTSQRWAEGPADNVRMFMTMFQSSSKSRGIDEVMVLPSDQLYRMDFAELVDYHRNHDADLTIVCRPCAPKEVEQMGVVKTDRQAMIRQFKEKPTGDDKAAMSMDWEEMQGFMESTGVKLATTDVEASMDEEGRGWVGSCGMYVFRRQALSEVLEKHKRIKDFGRELIPQMIKDGYKVVAYCFSGYWEDIGGSLTDFYKGNMKLLQANPLFDFNSQMQPFYSYPVTLPASLISSGSKVRNSMIAGGCTIEDAEITRSIIGQRQNIGKGCKIQDSIVMGLDYYEAEKSQTRKHSRVFPPMGIAEGTSIKKAMIDKDARIGKNCVLENREGVWESFDRIKSGICIREGLIIISKGAVVPDGTII